MMQDKTSCMLLAIVAIAALYFVIDMTTRRRAFHPSAYPHWSTTTPMSQIGSACSAAMASQTTTAGAERGESQPKPSSARAGQTSPVATTVDPKHTVGGPKNATDMEDNNSRAGVPILQAGICMKEPKGKAPDTLPCNQEIED